MAPLTWRANPSVDDERDINDAFVALICADEDFLHSQFEAIVEGVVGEGPPGVVGGDRSRNTEPPKKKWAAGGLKPRLVRSSRPGFDDSRRERSPPPPGQADGTPSPSHP